MKINLKKDQEKSELLAAMASKNREESLKAQTAFAALVGPVIPQVLNHYAASKVIYKDIPYAMDEVPSIPRDLYQDNIEGLFFVWSQATPGGLATQEVWGHDEWRFKTYCLDSAISFSKVYARQARLDVVAKAIERLSQEILVKTEYQAWNTVLTALAGASTNGADHLISATTAGNFQLDDVNRLWTFVKRLRNSWVGGTPIGAPGRGLTDLFVSPEVTEKIRAMAYNPVNTTAVPNTDESTALGLPDAMRERIYTQAGMPEIFGVKINELNELGVGKIYNSIFDSVLAAAGGVSFDGSTQEIVLGFDLSLESAIRVIASDSETGSTFQLEPDDQFVARQQKVGWYGSLEEGRIVMDNKAFVGLIK